MKSSQLNELLYQALETEIGGQKIHRAAIECAARDDPREEWEKYLAETPTTSAFFAKRSPGLLDEAGVHVVGDSEADKPAGWRGR